MSTDHVEDAPPTRSKTVGPPRRAHRTGDKTRDAILRSACSAFAAKGFLGVSLRGVARDAGVDHSTLLHHFSNKEGLLLAVLRWRDTSAAPPAPPGELSVALIVSLLVDVARRNQLHPEQTQLFSTMSAEAGTPGHPARQYLQDRHQIHLRLFTAAVEAAREKGLVPTNGLTPTECAARLVATWEGLEVFDRLHPGLIDLPKVLEVTLQEAFGIGDGTEASDLVVSLRPDPNGAPQDPRG